MGIAYLCPADNFLKRRGWLDTEVSRPFDSGNYLLHNDLQETKLPYQMFVLNSEVLPS